MPVGPDTHRDGGGRANRDLRWENTTGAGDYGQTGGSPEFRHQGKDFEYLVRHEPESEGHGADNPWVTSIWDDTGRYDTVSGRSASLGEAQSLAQAYHSNEWRPGSDYDLGDLVDPQDGTYEEEGTHGIPLAIKAAVTGYSKFRKTPTGRKVEAAAIEGGREMAVKGKEKLAERRAEKKAHAEEEEWGPKSDDPFGESDPLG